MASFELDEVQWCSPEWVRTFGLYTGNVLEYFSQSPFYDRSSNNQVLKMQSNFNEQLQGRRDTIAQDLRNMKGIEYQVVIEQEPSLWVIVKQDRKSPVVTETLAIYFISGQNIFQSSSIYNILSSRLLATSKYLYDGLKSAEKLPKFEASGYFYDTQQGDNNEDKGTGIEENKNDEQSSMDTEATGEDHTEESKGATTNSNQEEDQKNTQRDPSLDIRYLNSSLDKTILQLRRT